MTKKKITQEELNQVQAYEHERAQIKDAMYKLYAEKKLLQEKETSLADMAAKFEDKYNLYKEKLLFKYGDVDVDINSGTITENEKT